MFVRFQSAVPNARGTFPGVFAMANGLHRAGLLTDQDASWLRRRNDHCEQSYTDPSTVDPECYDPVANPGARAWFRESARDRLDLAREYIDLLDAYDVPWVEIRTRRPGRIVYQDEVQVVAVPFTHGEHWPFIDRRAGERTTSAATDSSD